MGYLQHGRRHRRGGTDPINDELPWGFYAASATLVTDGVVTVDLEGTLSEGTELFDFSAGVDLPAPLADGMYDLQLCVTAETFTPDPTKFFLANLTKVGTLRVFGNMAPLLSVISDITLPQAAVTTSFPLTTADQFQIAVRQTLTTSVTYSALLMAIQTA